MNTKEDVSSRDAKYGNVTEYPTVAGHENTLPYFLTLSFVTLIEAMITMREAHTLTKCPLKQL